jgi:cell division protein ZapA (FtsZ GTPase activity inhibitor)
MQSDESDDNFEDVDDQADADVKARAFKLTNNSCGPDSLTVVAAVTVLASLAELTAEISPSFEVAAASFEQLAVMTRRLIHQTARNPSVINRTIEAQLADVQRTVMQRMAEQLPSMTTGMTTDLRDLLAALCTQPGTGAVRMPFALVTETIRHCSFEHCSGQEPHQPEELFCVEITGSDVVSGPLHGMVHPGSGLYDMENCLQRCATLYGESEVDSCPTCNGKRRSEVVVHSLPKWLPVLLR